LQWGIQRIFLKKLALDELDIALKEAKVDKKEAQQIHQSVEQAINRTFGLYEQLNVT
jgi:hypothetical protein